MSHFWPDGLPITAFRAVDGTLNRLFIEGKRHKIVEIVRHWQIADEWWAAEVVRDYYKLITDSGLLLIVYEDAGGWWLQRLYD